MTVKEISDLTSFIVIVAEGQNIVSDSINSMNDDFEKYENREVILITPIKNAGIYRLAIMVDIKEE